MTDRLTPAPHSHSRHPAAPPAPAAVGCAVDTGPLGHRRRRGARPEITWAALDCPSGIAAGEAADLRQDTAVLLGQM